MKGNEGDTKGKEWKTTGYRRNVIENAWHKRTLERYERKWRERQLEIRENETTKAEQLANNQQSCRENARTWKKTTGTWATNKKNMKEIEGGTPNEKGKLKGKWKELKGDELEVRERERGRENKRNMTWTCTGSKGNEGQKKTDRHEKKLKGVKGDMTKNRKTKEGSGRLRNRWLGPSTPQQFRIVRREAPDTSQAVMVRKYLIFFGREAGNRLLSAVVKEMTCCLFLQLPSLCPPSEHIDFPQGWGPMSCILHPGVCYLPLTWQKLTICEGFADLPLKILHCCGVEGPCHLFWNRLQSVSHLKKMFFCKVEGPCHLFCSRPLIVSHLGMLNMW